MKKLITILLLVIPLVGCTQEKELTRCEIIAEDLKKYCEDKLTDL